MNILNLAYQDRGGAGVVSNNTNQYFNSRGFNSVLVVEESSKKNKNVIAFRQKALPGSFQFMVWVCLQKFIRLYRRFFPFNVNKNYSFHNLTERKRHRSAKEILSRVPFKPDVILIYWVSGFINTKTIYDLEKITGAKLLWIMTDNAPLTGGCHYPWQCKGFETDCSDCPGILTKSKKKIPQKNLAFKKKYLPENIDLFVGSTSDYNRAKRSLLFKDKEIKRIFAPIDETKFCPGNKKEARSFFGIPTDKKVIFYGASEFKYLRKGGQLFLDAINQLVAEQKNATTSFIDVTILIAGKDWQQYFDKTRFPIMDIGFLNENELITAYQASDMFVSPSIEDSGPSMVLQSIMCGTPVVAFNTGIAMDIVQKGKTGYLAKLGDSDDLAYGIRYMLSLSEQERIEISNSCRKLALTKYSTDNYFDILMDSFPEKNLIPAALSVD